MYDTFAYLVVLFSVGTALFIAGFLLFCVGSCALAVVSNFIRAARSRFRPPSEVEQDESHSPGGWL